MNQVSGQFQQFADPITINGWIPIGVRRRVFSDSDFGSANP